MNPPVTRSAHHNTEDAATTPDSRCHVRLVEVGGPLQTLTACAAVRHLTPRNTDLVNVLLVEEVAYVADTSAMLPVITACAASVEWRTILETTPARLLHQLHSILGKDFEVTEFISWRDPHPMLDAFLDLFPQACKITTGDGLGVYWARDTEQGAPHFDEFVATIPDARRPLPLPADRLGIVPRDTALEVIAAVERSHPQLADLDRHLAKFTRDGVLVILGYASEVGLMTPRLELLAAYLQIQLTTGRRRVPILLKPHPRASLGQAAALARRLRRNGHTVMIMPTPWNMYPIEVFPRTIRAASTIHPGESSARLSIPYFYNVQTADPRIPWQALLRFPTYIRSTWYWIRWTRMIVNSLKQWTREAPFEYSGPRFPGMLDRTLGFFPRRVFRWHPVTATLPPQSREEIRSQKRTVSAYLDDGPNGDIATIIDQEYGIRWKVPRESDAELAINATLSRQCDSTLERLHICLGTLISIDFQDTAVLSVLTRVPSYLPRWLAASNTADAVYHGQSLPTAEEVEQTIELYADTLSRSPELTAVGLLRSRYKRGTRMSWPMMVTFRLRLRKPSVLPQLATS